MACKPPQEQTAEPNDVVRFDEVLNRLRSVVERLESGNLSLEDGLRYFEEGMELCRQGAAVLDKAEKRVEVLLANAGDGTTTVPLDPSETTEADK